MKTVKFINGIGAEITLSDSEPFLMEKFSQSTGATQYTIKGSGQDGTKFIENTLNESDITVKLSVVGNTKDEYNRYTNQIRKIFNPRLGPGYFVYNDGEKDFKLICVPDKVFFPEEVGRIAGKGIISLTAHDPYWHELLQKKEEIALWVGDFEFDFLNGLQIPEEGIIMGHRELSLIVNCPNDGDGEAGMIIEFRALATLTNPSLRNVNTQEYVKLIKTMVAGEIIRVNTHFAEEDVEMELNGVTSNAFNYIDEDMTFLKLYQGDNLFRYDAETGLDNLIVNIYRQNKYLGV
jgi:hypothetical protein